LPLEIELKELINRQRTRLKCQKKKQFDICKALEEKLSNFEKEQKSIKAEVDYLAWVKSKMVLNN